MRKAFKAQFDDSVQFSGGPALIQTPFPSVSLTARITAAVSTLLQY
jgi:hypothetical protein